MSKKANPTIVGVFVVGAVALLVAGVVVVGSGKLFEPRLAYVAFFDGSVKGLRLGAPVNFRGVRVGSVTDILVRLDPGSGDVRIPVHFELEPSRLAKTTDEDYQGEEVARKRMKQMIDRGLRAHLEVESFVTGQLAVELDFSPDKGARYVGKDERFPEFPTIPSTVEELTSTLKDLPVKEMFESLNRTVAGVEKLVTLLESTGGVQSLAQALEDLRKLIQDVNKQIAPVATAMTETLRDGQKVLRTLDSRIAPLAADSAKTLQDTRSTLRSTNSLVMKLDAQVKPVATGFLKSLEETRATLQQARKTLATFDSVAAGRSKLGYQLSQALKELSEAARSLRQAAEFLQRHPESLIHGKAGAKGK